MSRGVLVAASDENLWREVLQHQFDIFGKQGCPKTLVKKLYMGASEEWEGMCLDNWTAQWTPYPLVIEGAQIVTNPAVLASLPGMTAACDGGREFLSFPQSALTALCRWPSLQDCLTRMVAQLYPVGAGLGNAWFVCETSGRCARCVTFTETEVVCGSGALVPCSYWGFLIGSVFLGRYANGGAVCLFFKEVCPPPAPTLNAPLFPGDPSNTAPPDSASCGALEEELLLTEGDYYEGIIVWPGGCGGDEMRDEFLRVVIHKIQRVRGEAGASSSSSSSSASSSSTPPSASPHAADIPTSTICHMRIAHIGPHAQTQHALPACAPGYGRETEVCKQRRGGVGKGVGEGERGWKVEEGGVSEKGGVRAGESEARMLTYADVCMLTYAC